MRSYQDSWLMTAADYHTMAAQERAYADMTTLPARIRRQSATLAIKFEADAIECEGYAALGRPH